MLDIAKGVCDAFKLDGGLGGMQRPPLLPIVGVRVLAALSPPQPVKNEQKKRVSEKGNMHHRDHKGDGRTYVSPRGSATSLGDRASKSTCDHNSPPEADQRRLPKAARGS